MRTLAICAENLTPVAWAASGVEPMASPPLTSEWVRPGTLSGYDLLYLCLYGVPGQPWWFGDRLTPAVTQQAVAEADLSRTVVFLAGRRQDNETMLRALLYAGPRAIVSAGTEDGCAIGGADALGLYYRKALAWLRHPLLAYSWTRARALLLGPRPARRALRSLMIWRQRCT